MTGEVTTERCKAKITTIIQEHNGIISEFERKLLMGVGGEHPILPSLNLMPKVHKLSDPACQDNKVELRGRPIVQSTLALRTPRYCRHSLLRTKSRSPAKEV